MKCSQCGRRGHANRTSCLYCGGAFVKESRTGPLICSACGGSMAEVERNGVMIDVCTSCGGIWFDSGELEALAAQPSRAKSVEARLPNRVATGPMRFTPEQHAYRNCPVCDKMMGRQNYKRFSGVIIDVCQDHGCFLDPMEFEKIQMFLRSGGANKYGQRIENEQRERIKRESRPKTDPLLRKTKFYDPKAKANAINQNDSHLLDAVLEFVSAIF